MRAFFTKHIYAIFWAVLINIPHIWRGIIFITDWLQRFDFWATHGREIAGVSEVIGLLSNPPPWTVFFTSAAAVAIIYLDVRRQARVPETATAFDSVQGLKLTFFSGCAVVVVALWAMAWPLYFPVQTKPPPEVAPPPPKPLSQAKPTPELAPPLPKPVEPPNQPPAPVPWVTSEEIETQRKLGKTLLVYSPEELTALSGGGQNLKVYENKWTKVDYPVIQLPVIETVGNNEFYVVYVLIEKRYGTQEKVAVYGNQYMAAYFDPKRWGDRLLGYRTNTKIKALCQFAGFGYRTAINPYGTVLLGYNCELF
jgi:hypothetical protein